MPINYSLQDESPPAMSIFKKTGEVLDEALESPSDGQNNLYKRKKKPHRFLGMNKIAARRYSSSPENGDIAVYITKYSISNEVLDIASLNVCGLSLQRI